MSQASSSPSSAALPNAASREVAYSRRLFQLSLSECRGDCHWRRYFFAAVLSCIKENDPWRYQGANSNEIWKHILKRVLDLDSESDSPGLSKELKAFWTDVEIPLILETIRTIETEFIGSDDPSPRLSEDHIEGALFQVGQFNIPGQVSDPEIESLYSAGGLAASSLTRHTGYRLSSGEGRPPQLQVNLETGWKDVTTIDVIERLGVAPSQFVQIFWQCSMLGPGRRYLPTGARGDQPSSNITPPSTPVADNKFDCVPSSIIAAIKASGKLSPVGWKRLEATQSRYGLTGDLGMASKLIHKHVSTIRLAKIKKRPHHTAMTSGYQMVAAFQAPTDQMMHCVHVDGKRGIITDSVAKYGSTERTVEGLEAMEIPRFKEVRAVQRQNINRKTRKKRQKELGLPFFEPKSK